VALILPAYAKLNLTLDVVGRRPNGYHDIDSVMQTISLHDLLWIERTDCRVFDVIGPPIEGENLWAGTPRAYSPEAMVALWAAEKTDYRPGVFPNNSRSGDLERVGHYTQLIWRGSGQVGCATAIGRDEEFLVCRYSGAGNVYGERPA